MTQSTGFDAAGQGSSGTDWRNTTTSSAGPGISGGHGMSQDGMGSSFNQGSSDRNSSQDQGWMSQFGGGQSGDMMSSLRDFSRNNRAATIGGSILAVLALARYASSSGKRHQKQRYSGGGWTSSGRSGYGDDDRSRREDYRGGGGYSRDSFSASNRYTGGNSSWGGQTYGGLRRAGRYGMKHPMSLTAGAALGAMALSWLARGRGQQGSHQGGWHGSDQSFGGQDMHSGGSQDFGSGQSFAGQTGSGSSFSGAQSGSSMGGRSFGEGSSGQSFGSGRMGTDAIEAAGSSSDIGQSTTGSTFGRGRTGTGSTSTGGI